MFPFFTLWRNVLRRPVVLFSALMLLALAGRFWVLQQLSQSALGCRLCVMPGLLQADLPYLSMLGGLFAMSCLVTRRWWSIPWRLLAALGLVAYVADAIVLAQFATRLSLADLRVYLEQFDVASKLLGTLAWWQWLPVTAWGGLLLGLCLLRPHRKLAFPTSVAAVLLWGGLAVFGRFAIPAPEYVHDWAIRNVLMANLGNDVTQPYSEETRERWLSESDDTAKPCWDGEVTRENIVMLVLESWSPYHSQLWTGLNNWTPRLDALAREGTRFSRLHAGGYNTNEGLISLLTGRPFVLPLSPPGEKVPFETAWGLSGTLPQRLGARGYRSAFLTSGDLSFTRKREWLQDIGFEIAQGQEQSDYEGVERLHFNSVPDDVLYEHALKVIEKFEGSQRPYFTVIENVSSHHPYVHPYTGERSEQAVIRYVDEAAADFIAKLRSSGFLDGGMLVVVSDHRAMSFVSSKERQLLGLAAASRIPGFILTGEEAEPGRNEVALLQQADIPATLLARVSQQVCNIESKRNMLSPITASSSRCVMHARGDQRDHVDVFCPNGQGTVEVAGEDSRFVASEGLTAERRQVLLDRIAKERIRASAHDGAR